MEKFNELLEELNKQKITQTQGGWEDNIPDDIWEEYFTSNNSNNYRTIITKLTPDTHRWYEISTTVIKIFDRYLGITFISNLFSESTMYEYCCINLEFGEMKIVESITYEPI